jgi:hypothetical protein
MHYRYLAITVGYRDSHMRLTWCFDDSNAYGSWILFGSTLKDFKI